jgi:hypothetical protein
LLQCLDTLPVQLDGAGRGRLEQRLSGTEVVRCGARRQFGAAVDLSVGQTADAVIAQDVDRGVEDLVPSFRVGRHQFL